MGFNKKKKGNGCYVGCYTKFVTDCRKRAHFAQELISRLKYVTPLDFVHNSDSLKRYNFSQEDQFIMLQSVFESIK